MLAQTGVVLIFKCTCQLRLCTLGACVETSKDMIYLDLLLKDFYGAESWLFNLKCGNVVVVLVVVVVVVAVVAVAPGQAKCIPS